MDSCKSKVINIKSEILCRSAEDDFFYFNNVNSAYKKLKESVSLTPNHLKSLILFADIAFIKGHIKKALKLYKTAENINGENIKVLASVANCLFVLEDYKKALSYCDKIIAKFNSKHYGIFSQVFEIKISILISQKNYEQAFRTVKQAKNLFDNNFLKTINSINYEVLNEKINLQKKLQKSGLKIV